PLVPLQETDAPAAPAAGPMQSLVIDANGAGSLTSLPAGAPFPLLDPTGNVLPLEAVEAAAIRFAIAHYRGQISEVARKLRIGRSTLYRKLDSLGLGGGSAERDREDVAARLHPHQIDGVAHAVVLLPLGIWSQLPSIMSAGGVFDRA